MRASSSIARMVRETELSINDLIYPMFVTHGNNVKTEILAMPGNYRFSVDMLEAEIKEISELGIPAVILFGIPEHKDEHGTGGYDPEGEVQRAIKEIKRVSPELTVITDVCIDEYCNSGHCGVVSEEGEILNDPTLPLLAKMALSHAEAGADMVAPSDMMDGATTMPHGATSWRLSLFS